jgi:hypothetical protein
MGDLDLSAEGQAGGPVRAKCAPTSSGF